MRKRSPELPADIFYKILEHVPPRELLNLNLVCHTFAHVGRTQHFANVTLRNLEHAQALAKLIACNKNLLSSTSHFGVGKKVHVREVQNSAAPLWDWLGGADGHRVLSSLKAVQHVTLCSVTCATPGAIRAQDKTIRALQHLARSSPAICSVAFWDGYFVTAPMAVAIMDIFPGAVLFDLNYRLVPLDDGVLHFTSLPPRQSSPVSSLVLRNVDSTDQTSLLQIMIETSRLDCLQHLTIWLVNPSMLQRMAVVLESAALTLQSMTFDHIEARDRSTWYRPRPVFAFRPMRKLRALRVRWFEMSVSSWLTAVLKPLFRETTELDELSLYPVLTKSSLEDRSPNQFRLPEWDDLAVRVKSVVLVVYLTYRCPMTNVMMRASTEDVAQAVLPNGHAQGRIRQCLVRRSKINDYTIVSSKHYEQLERFYGDEHDEHHCHAGTQNSKVQAKW